MFRVIENAYGPVQVQFSPSFSAVDLVGGPFYASTSIEYTAGEYLLVFESFEEWLKSLSQKPLTLEGACREIFDVICDTVFPVELKVEVQVYTPEHAAASAILTLPKPD